MCTLISAFFFFFKDAHYTRNLCANRKKKHSKIVNAFLYSGIYGNNNINNKLTIFKSNMQSILMLIFDKLELHFLKDVKLK